MRFFMDITLAVLMLLLFLVIIPFIITDIIKRFKKKNNIIPKIKLDKDIYSIKVIIETENEFNNLKQGKYKKHVLRNNAKYYDSGETLLRYQKFLSSNAMKEYVIECEEGRYYG